jgi:hypothetical protein
LLPNRRRPSSTVHHFATPSAPTEHEDDDEDDWRSRSTRPKETASVRVNSAPNLSMTPRGSTFECATGLDASVAKGFVSIDRVRPGKEMLACVVAMLTRLIDRFDSNSRTA